MSDYVINGKNFSSKSELAKEYRTSVTRIDEKLLVFNGDMSEVINSIIKEYNLFSYKGRWMRIPEIAEDIGVNKTTLYRRLSKMTLDEAIGTPFKKRSIIVHEKEYSSLKEVADAFGVSYDSLKLIKNKHGLDVESAIEFIKEKEITKHIIDGYAYSGFEINEKFGIRHFSRYNRKHGEHLSPKEIVVLAKLRRGFVYIDGEFVHVSEVSNHSGLKESYILACVENGVDPQDFIKEDFTK